MKAKFKIGDLVYCIAVVEDILQWFVLAKSEIKKIVVYDKKIRYCFLDTCGIELYFKEEDCFLSQEEASVECRKRNIKLKNEQKSFAKKIKWLAAMLHKKMDITIEFDSEEEENRSEIEEQIRYEAKGKSYEIKWINKE
jgi:hypothetical protein